MPATVHEKKRPAVRHRRDAGRNDNETRPAGPSGVGVGRLGTGRQERIHAPRKPGTGRKTTTDARREPHPAAGKRDKLAKRTRSTASSVLESQILVGCRFLVPVPGKVRNDGPTGKKASRSIDELGRPDSCRLGRARVGSDDGGRSAALGQDGKHAADTLVPHGRRGTPDETCKRFPGQGRHTGRETVGRYSGLSLPPSQKVGCCGLPFPSFRSTGSQADAR